MNHDDPTVELTWTAPQLRKVTVLHVAAVFAAFMVVAQFVFHSAEAVRALFLTAIGSVAALAPGVLTRIEYRLTERGLEKRPVRSKQPGAFKDVFAWDQVSHLTPTRMGFKFYKRTEAPNPFRRFLELHVLAGHAGEVHVEPPDRERVAAVLTRHGIPIYGSAGRRRIEG